MAVTVYIDKEHFKETKGKLFTKRANEPTREPRPCDWHPEEPTDDEVFAAVTEAVGMSWPTIAELVNAGIKMELRSNGELSVLHDECRIMCPRERGVIRDTTVTGKAVLLKIARKLETNYRVGLPSRA